MPTSSEMEASFLADIAARPDDPAPKLAYADWLREKWPGDTLAYAYEWAARRRMRPSAVTWHGRPSWLWHERTPRLRLDYPDHLPPPVFAQLKGGLPMPVPWARRYRTLAVAFAALADALDRLRAALSLEG
jgi:uncharacterized protein (TIGR02996 family)